MKWMALPSITIGVRWIPSVQSTRFIINYTTLYYSTVWKQDRRYDMYIICICILIPAQRAARSNFISWWFKFNFLVRAWCMIWEMKAGALNLGGQYVVGGIKCKEYKTSPMSIAGPQRSSRYGTDPSWRKPALALTQKCCARALALKSCKEPNNKSAYFTAAVPQWAAVFCSPLQLLTCRPASRRSHKGKGSSKIMWYSNKRLCLLEIHMSLEILR